MPEFELIENRSRTNGNSAFVRFINRTERVIEIVWLNYYGEYTSYRTLKKCDFVDVNTYDTHFWVAFDYDTRDRLLIDNEYVYQPKTSRAFLAQRFPDRVINDNQKVRIPAYITIPVYTLRYNAILTIRNLLKSSEDADRLEIPKPLIEDIKKVIKLRDNLRYTLSYNNSNT